jgi:hypothetical protein
VLVSDRIARRVGAGILIAGLVGAVATMLLSGHNIAPGFILHVDFERIANLRVGSRVMMCGREVGEVVAVRFAPKASFLQKKAAAPGEPEEPRLTLDLWLRWQYQSSIHRNSELFVNQTGILGEQYLEIGAPRGAPGPTVAWGDRLRGADPPRLDRMLQQAHRTLQMVTTVMRELKPMQREIAAALDHVRAIAKEAGIDATRTRVLYHRVVATIDEGRAVYAALQQGTHNGADVKALRADFERLGDRVGDDLRVIGREIDRVMARLDAAKDLWSPARRARLTKAIATLRRVVTVGEQLARDTRAIIAMVERGEGTVGAFMKDQELWDDFHAIHRILKDKSWSTVIRPSKPVRE